MPKEPSVDLQLAIEHGLSEEEYEKICTTLGRTPTYTELGIYSVMWSEHCSYKNSLLQLKTLPREGERLLVGAGEENAGLVDIGDGLAIAFKIETPLIRCAPHSALISSHGIPHTFSVYDLKKVK